MLKWLFILTPSIAAGLTGNSDARHPPAFSLDGNQHQVHDIFLNDEISDFGNQDQSSFDLNVTPNLVGQAGITAKQALAKLTPDLQNCQIELASVHTSKNGRDIHERYHLRFGLFRLHNTWLSLHHNNHRLSALRARLPSFKLPSDVYTEADFLPLERLQVLDAAVLAKAHAERVIADHAGQTTPAWEISYFNQETGQTQIWMFDAQTGAQLQYDTMVFNIGLASVYERSPHDGKLIDVILNDLKPTGFLDGEYFSVYAPTVAEPRAQSPFVFLPNDPSQTLEFDQVQVYYSTSRALSWLKQKFGYDLQKIAQLTVRINEVAAGSKENSQYLPPPQGPAILIGSGGATLNDLARDGDVVTHELLHHVIYEFLRSHRGESGIIHEGTADYFVYALNQDPHLAISTTRTGEPLRTAALPREVRFDSFSEKNSVHQLGQIWSAFLWDLRQELGEIVDQIVYEGLAYLGPQSGIRDAIVALISADASLHEGRHRCHILDAAVERGFGLVLGELDGSRCGLDLTQISIESRKISQNQKAETDKSIKPQEEHLRERLCGIIGGKKSQNHLAMISYAMLLLGLLPWIKVWISKKS